MNPWDTLTPEQVGKVWEHPAEVETDADLAWLKRQVETGNIVSDRDLGDETEYDGTEGQDRKSYSDTQDRENYTDEELE